MSSLTKEERTRVSDGKHNVQAAANVLSGVDRTKIPNIEEIEACLEKADQSLRDALGKPPAHPNE